MTNRNFALHAIIAAFVLAMSCGAAMGANPDGIFCRKDRDGTLAFAGKQLPDGRLVFGFDRWYPNGHFIGVAGYASRQDGHWVYTDQLDAPDPAERCRVTIEFPSGGPVRLTADPVAKCENDGGYGTEIGTLVFPRASRQGPVRSELDDVKEFFEEAHPCDSQN